MKYPHPALYILVQLKMKVCHPEALEGSHFQRIIKFFKGSLQMVHRTWGILALTTLTSLTLSAQTVTIGDQEYNNLQQAINKAVPGDVIDIRGTHQASLKLHKKGVILRGENPLEDVIGGVSGLGFPYFQASRHRCGSIQC